MNMKSMLLLILAGLALVGCAKPPEQVYTHPNAGQADLSSNVQECSEIADRFGYINMSPVHQYPMENMKDHAQRERIFRFCMLKKGYEI